MVLQLPTAKNSNKGRKSEGRRKERRKGETEGMKKGRKESRDGTKEGTKGQKVRGKKGGSSLDVFYPFRKQNSPTLVRNPRKKCQTQL